MGLLLFGWALGRDEVVSGWVRFQLHCWHVSAYVAVSYSRNNVLVIRELGGDLAKVVALA